METGLKTNVANLDARHRRALEELIGRELTTNVRVIVSIIDVAADDATGKPAQTLEDWTRVYDGLNGDQVQAVDQIVNSRADLTRSFPG